MNDHSQTRYWVNIVTQDNVRKNIAGGFMQADGKSQVALEEIGKGDFVVFYSPRNRFRNGKPLQEFTGLGAVEDDKPYHATQGSAQMLRRKVDYLSDQAVSIHPLIPTLTFIPDKEKWGLPFNKGLFEIENADFVRIAEAMGIEGGI